MGKQAWRKLGTGVACATGLAEVADDECIVDVKQGSAIPLVLQAADSARCGICCERREGQERVS
jgi:hypothetical protein